MLNQPFQSCGSLLLTNLWRVGFKPTTSVTCPILGH